MDQPETINVKTEIIKSFLDRLYEHPEKVREIADRQWKSMSDEDRAMHTAIINGLGRIISGVTPEDKERASVLELVTGFLKSEVTVIETLNAQVTLEVNQAAKLDT